MAVATTPRPFYHRTSPFWNILRWTELVLGLIAAVLMLLFTPVWLGALVVAAFVIIAFALLAGRNTCFEIGVAFVLMGIAFGIAYEPVQLGFSRFIAWSGYGGQVVVVASTPPTTQPAVKQPAVAQQPVVPPPQATPVDNKPAVVAAQPTSAPADGPKDTAYAVDGNVVTVTVNGQACTKITFSKGVDNSPTEWLKNRPVAYLYQSGIGNKLDVEIELSAGCAFAMDGDWASAGGQDLGKVNDPADFLLFSDQPGTYKVTASSFGLAIAGYNGEKDKAGNVLQDRRDATGWDNRPVFYIAPDGTVKKV